MIRPWCLSLQVKKEMWQNHLCRKLMWGSRDTMNSQATVHLPLLWNKDYDDTRGGSKCHVPTPCQDLYPRQLRSHFSLPCEIGKFSICLLDMRKLGVYSQMTLPKLQIQKHMEFRCQFVLVRASFAAKKTPPWTLIEKLRYSWTSERHFLNWGPCLSNGSSLCQVHTYMAHLILYQSQSIC